MIRLAGWEYLPTYHGGRWRRIPNRKSIDMSEREPIRLTVYLAAAVVALSTFFGALGIVDDVTAQTVYAAAGASLMQFAGIAFAAELARSKAWAPATVNELVDAEAVIREADESSPLAS